MEIVGVIVETGAVVLRAEAAAADRAAAGVAIEAADLVLRSAVVDPDGFSARSFTFAVLLARVGASHSRRLIRMLPIACGRILAPRFEQSLR